MNPSISDNLKVTFPNYISIYALAKYSYDPVAARYALMNNYDILQNELVTNLKTPADIAADAQFTAEPKESACEELNTLAMSLYGQIINMAATASDLSGVALLAGSFHDENRKLQSSSSCTGQTGTPSPACIKLASQDETLFPVLQQFDKANLSMLTNGQSIQDILNLVLQTYNGLGCNLPINPDSGPSISSVFSSKYLDTLGTIDTETLSTKLEELSPYYVSPTLIRYISRQLTATSEFNTQLETTDDYIADMSKMTNAIVSLTTQLQPGKFYDESGSAGIKTCPAGFYCPPTTTAPLVCPVGYYCPPGTLSLDDVKCPNGTFSPLGSSDQSSCVNKVPAGYYNLKGVATQCIKGAYCPENSNNPTPCPSGTYNSLSGKASSIGVCLPCPRGSYCKPDKSTTGTSTLDCTAFPTPCKKGSYSSTMSATSSSTCILCPVGTQCPSKGMPSATPCPAGTFSNVIGLSGECIPGNAGTYSNTIGATDQSSFKPCPIGYYCPKGAGYKVSCPKGSYCPNTSLTAAIKCPAGTYGNSLNSISPTCDGPCDAGSYCPAGSLVSNPGPCPVGNYCPTGTASPIPCPAGYYCPVGSPSPSPCLPGTYSSTVGNERIGNCLGCPPGSYCASATSNPSACPIGYFCAGNNSEPGNTMGKPATPCPGGYYCDMRGMAAPTACPGGTYNNTVGATSMVACIHCQGGLYSASSGQTSCSGMCPVGTYCPSSTKCYMYTPPSNGDSGSGSGSGSDSGSPLPVSIPIGSTNPITCPAGTYCDKTGMAKPTKCPTGTTSSSTGATSSITCH